MGISDWLEEKTLKIKEFGEAVTSGFTSDENAAARYEICKECEYYGIKTSGNKLLLEKGCDICKCYLPLKTLFRDSKCPKGYWPEEILEDVERIVKPNGEVDNGIFGEGRYNDK